ncbi:MAG: histidinol-phosphate transaminase [Syntrophorhabdaceae bacterium]|nr:histidinol-phosphate transaminase [Syntrophorhabdaceae bacterium]
MKLTIDGKIGQIPFYPKAKKYGTDNGWIKLASNENPYPPSPKAISAILDALFSVNRYPGGEYELKKVLGERYGLAPENVVLGDGSDELIELVLKAARSPDRDVVIVTEPCFAFYEIASKIYGYRVVKVPLEGMKVKLDSLLKATDKRTRIIFLNNPLNPTGTIFEEEEFVRFLNELPDEILVVVDEAYGEFTDSKNFPRSHRFTKDYPVVILRTFSKAYALAGLRIGYGLAEASLISYMERTQQPFSVNALAIAGALGAIEDQHHLEMVLENNRKGKAFLYNAFKEMGISYVPTEANFILFKDDNARVLTEMLYEDRVVVRWMGPYGLPEYVRVSIGKIEENQRFIEALKRRYRIL